MKSPAVKRLMREAKELSFSTDEYYAQPVEDNLFEWHFTVRGPPETDFELGIYHGRIVLPPEYPMKPPSIILLTPNGRFEVNKKICLSISGHHPESWQPSWSIRTALLAIIGFMPTPGLGAIGSLDYTTDERRSLAKKSHAWSCSVCGSIQRLISERSDACRTEVNEEAKSLARQITFKGEIEQKNGTKEEGNETEPAVVDSTPPKSNEEQTGSEAEHDTSSARSLSFGGLSYLAAFLVAAIAALVFRRLFVL